MIVIRLALAAQLLAAGCTYGLHDIRQSPAVSRVRIERGEYLRLASCATRHLESMPVDRVAPAPGNYLYELRDDPEARRATVVARAGLDAIVEFAFAQDGEAVTIETRRHPSPILADVERQSWPVVERCATARP